MAGLNVRPPVSSARARISNSALGFRFQRVHQHRIRERSWQDGEDRGRPPPRFVEHVRELDTAPIVLTIGEQDDRLAALLVRVHARAGQLAQRDVQRFVHRRRTARHRASNRRFEEGAITAQRARNPDLVAEEHDGPAIAGFSLRIKSMAAFCASAMRPNMLPLVSISRARSSGVDDAAKNVTVCRFPSS